MDRVSRILRHVTTCVRCAGRDEFTNAYFGGSTNAALAFLRRNKSLFEVRRITARCYPVAETCLVHVGVDDPEPDFASLSRFLLRRHRNAAVCSRTIITASPVARRAFAATRVKLTASQLGHDLALSSLFYRWLAKEPDLDQRWIGEDSLPYEFGETKPDALVGGSLVVDFGGAYSAARLAEIHNYCTRGQLAYELW